MKKISRSALLISILVAFPVVALSEEIGFLSRASGGGSVLVVKSIEKGIDVSSQNQLCLAIDGTKVQIVEKKDYGEIKGFWVKVKILDGDCKSKIGWVANENIRLKDK